MKTIIIEHKTVTKENTDKGDNILYAFKTKALTGCENQTIKDHQVYITQGRMVEDKYQGRILSISGTPGSWYIATLMEGDYKAVDYKVMSVWGNWMCINWQDVVAELKEYLGVEKPSWYASKSAGEHQGIVADEKTGKTIAVTYDIKDAGIIAAAHDLLEACKAAEKHHQGSHSEIGEMLRSAIQKALITI